MLLKCLKANKQVLCKANESYIYLSPNTFAPRVLPQLFETKTIKTQTLDTVGAVVNVVCKKETTHKANPAILKSVSDAINNKKAFTVSLIGIDGIIQLSSVTL